MGGERERSNRKQVNEPHADSAIDRSWRNFTQLPTQLTALRVEAQAFDLAGCSTVAHAMSLACRNSQLLKQAERQSC